MSSFTNLDRLKLYLDWSGTGQDVLMQAMLDAAEDGAERYCRRKFSRSPDALADPAVTKTFSSRGRSCLRIPDLWKVSGVHYGGIDLLAGGYDLDAWGESDEEPAVEIRISDTYAAGLAFTQIGAFVGVQDVTITGWWGWYPAPPSGVLDATYRVAARMWREKDAAYSDVVQTETGGVLNYFRQLPETVKRELTDLRVMHVAVV